MTELELMRHFGSNLKNMLDYNNTTQRELADDIFVSEATISCYVRGERMPTLKNVINIAYALDCELSDLIDVYEFVD